MSVTNLKDVVQTFTTLLFANKPKDDQKKFHPINISSRNLPNFFIKPSSSKLWIDKILQHQSYKYVKSKLKAMDMSLLDYASIMIQYWKSNGDLGRYTRLIHLYYYVFDVVNCINDVVHFPIYHLFMYLNMVKKTSKIKIYFFYEFLIIFFISQKIYFL